MRIVTFFLAALFAGCVAEPSPVYDGYETARSHAYRGNGCSFRALEQSLWQLKNRGFSPRYREAFAQSYHGTCNDIMRRRGIRQKETTPSKNPEDDYSSALLVPQVDKPIARQSLNSTAADFLFPNDLFPPLPKRLSRAKNGDVSGFSVLSL